MHNHNTHPQHTTNQAKRTMFNTHVWKNTHVRHLVSINTQFHTQNPFFTPFPTCAHRHTDTSGEPSLSPTHCIHKHHYFNRKNPKSYKHIHVAPPSFPAHVYMHTPIKHTFKINIHAYSYLHIIHNTYTYPFICGFFIHHTYKDMCAYEWVCTQHRFHSKISFHPSVSHAQNHALAKSIPSSSSSPRCLQLYVVRFFPLSISTFTNNMWTCTQTTQKHNTKPTKTKKKNLSFSSHLTSSLCSPQPHNIPPLFKRQIIIYAILPRSLPNFIISTRLVHAQSAKSKPCVRVCVRKKKKQKQKQIHTHIHSFICFTPSYSNADKHPYTRILVTNPSFISCTAHLSPLLFSYPKKHMETSHTKTEKSQPTQPTFFFSLCFHFSCFFHTFILTCKHIAIHQNIHNEVSFTLMYGCLLPLHILISKKSMQTHSQKPNNNNNNTNHKKKNTLFHLDFSSCSYWLQIHICTPFFSSHLLLSPHVPFFLLPTTFLNHTCNTQHTHTQNKKNGFLPSSHLVCERKSLLCL